MARPFVVVGKSGAVVADLDHCFVELDEVHRRRLRGDDVDLALAKDRIERILREDVFDVGDEQFLMLLLVMNAENDDRLDLVEKFSSASERRFSMCESIEER